MDFVQGEVLLVDKPLEWTSFDVVNKLRYAISKKVGQKLKVGHAGTLDPLATGLLIVCSGKMTKQIDSLQAQAKEYTGTLKLGETTPSYDAETQPDAVLPTAHITPEAIHLATQQFVGKIDQIPPMFSALKVEGKTLYEQARKGKVIELAPRPVEITLFEITKIEMPFVEFRVCCSKGTYIRSLAHDFGKALQSGAYLTSLRRTKSGDFSIENAHTVEEWVELIKNS
ncbi:MAG: tRNA pseudouridine(55) synthase TruB [Bacteroidetes bacterium]|nr:MAG: tRNA pseudouridine(55) synthase TruB [Bacteroidota bacterium]